MSNQEDDLVERIRCRDSAALAELIAAKRLQILSFINQRLGAHLRGRLEPDDVLQDTAVSALKALPQLDLGDRDPFGWLCQLAEQRIIDRAREADAAKRDVQREMSGHQRMPGSDGNSVELIDMLAASLTSVTKAVVRNERQAKLDECLNRLPREVQDVLRMRYVEGITTREIGERIGKSDGAIRVLLSRTLKELQTALGLG